MRPRTERICEFCGKTYSRKEHYERHVRTHTRERPFNCTKCGSTFARLDSRRRHMRACHSANNASPPEVANIESPCAQDELPMSSLTTPTAGGLLATEPSVPGLSPSGLPSLSGALDWQWDGTLDLDASFSMEDLGTYDLLHANPSLPWLPLRPFAEPAQDQESISRPRTSQNISRQWFTRLSRNDQYSDQAPPPTGPSTPATTDQEFSRDALASSLQQRVPDTTLPSTQFLNRCIHLFTTRLWQVVPIVHLPTFRPAKTNPLLLISICSLGALADGSQDALYHAERLFEGVHKAILVSSSPNHVVRDQTLAVLQAAVIGQTFALLSGDPSHLFIFQSFHDTLFIAVKAFQDTLVPLSTIDDLTTTKESCEQEWREWILEQTIIRLLNAIYVHNGEFSSIVHKPSPIRTRPLNIQFAAPDNLFLAKTATEWAALKARYTSPHPNSCALSSVCATVACFVSESGHCRAAPFEDWNVQGLQILEGRLSQWFKESIKLIRTEEADRLSLLLLCHSAFLSIFCDIDNMEQVCGRDGPGFAEAKVQSLRTWAQTTAAERCLVHAILICKLLELARTSNVPAIYVARASWQAGLVLTIYSVFAPFNGPKNLKELAVSCAELDNILKSDLYTETDWMSATQDISAGRCKTLAFSLATTLRHLGPWRNARRYAETLDRILGLLEPQMPHQDNHAM